jgi:hypothetical protein
MFRPGSGLVVTLLPRRHVFPTTVTIYHSARGNIKGHDYGWRLINGDVFRCVVLSKRERLKEVKVWIHVYDVILHMTKQNE